MTQQTEKENKPSTKPATQTPRGIMESDSESDITKPEVEFAGGEHSGRENLSRLRRVVANISSTLAASKASLKTTVKEKIINPEMNDYASMNEAL